MISIFFFWGGGGVQEIEYFCEHEDFVDTFFCQSQNWTMFRVYFYAFRAFS